MRRWICRSDQPSRPSAMTCCFFSSLKTLAMPPEGYRPPRASNVPDAILVGRFSVITIGRFLGDRGGSLVGWNFHEQSKLQSVVPKAGHLPRENAPNENTHFQVDNPGPVRLALLV